MLVPAKLAPFRFPFQYSDNDSFVCLKIVLLTYYHLACISYTDFQINSEKVRKKLATGVKRVRETQEKIGVWMRVRPPDEGADFIGGAENEMCVGTNGRGHGGLVVGVSGETNCARGRDGFGWLRRRSGSNP